MTKIIERTMCACGKRKDTKSYQCHSCAQRQKRMAKGEVSKTAIDFLRKKL